MQTTSTWTLKHVRNMYENLTLFSTFFFNFLFFIFLLMAIYLGNGHSLVTAMLGKTTKAVRVYFELSQSRKKRKKICPL